MRREVGTVRLGARLGVMKVEIMDVGRRMDHQHLASGMSEKDGSHNLTFWPTKNIKKCQR